MTQMISNIKNPNKNNLEEEIISAKIEKTKFNESM